MAVGGDGGRGSGDGGAVMHYPINIYVKPVVGHRTIVHNSFIYSA